MLLRGTSSYKMMVSLEMPSGKFMGSTYCFTDGHELIEHSIELIVGKADIIRVLLPYSALEKARCYIFP